MSPIETFVGLFVAVAALTWVARRIDVEYPILLVLGGLLLGFIPGLPRVELEPSVVFLLFLPPLLYYEAFQSSIRDFKAGLRFIVLNAVFLVVVTIAAVAWIAHVLIPDLGWPAAVVLGAIVAPTDETAAIAIASRLRVPRAVITLVKAESLFNDGTSLVIYNVALVAAVTGTFSWAAGAWQLFTAAIGGVAIGLAVGWLVGLIRRGLDDLMLENTVSLLTGYAAYYPADLLHCSGVLSAIAAGLYLGKQSSTISSPDSRVQIGAMRDITLYLINGALFILVGLQLHPILAGLLPDADLMRLVFLGTIVSLVVIAVRIVWMFPAAYLPAIFARRRDPAGRLPQWRNVAVASWTGLRGGVSLAAAMAVPLVVATGAPFPNRQLILLITFAVILATLVGQGLTLPPLIRALNISAPDGEREETLARLKAARAAYAALDRLAGEPWADRAVVDDIRSHLKATISKHKGIRDHSLSPVQERRMESTRRIRSELDAAQRAEIERLHEEGAINTATLAKMQRELDLDAVRRGGP
jgi:Na+/H+ antiporter